MGNIIIPQLGDNDDIEANVERIKSMLRVAYSCGYADRCDEVSEAVKSLIDTRHFSKQAHLLGEI